MPLSKTASKLVDLKLAWMFDSCTERCSVIKQAWPVVKGDNCMGRWQLGETHICWLPCGPYILKDNNPPPNIQTRGRLSNALSESMHVVDAVTA